MIAPPPKQTVSEWADAERFLSSESSAEHGKWRTNRAPYQRGILDAFSDQDVETVVVQSSSQIGKTEIILNVLGYYIHKDPCPILLVQPILENAKDFSRGRITPMIRDTPCLSSLMGDKSQASRDSDNTLLNKQFPGGYVALAGANSPASLASKPIRVVLLDEVDRYPASAGDEGDPAKLAIKRTTAFYNKKIGYFSTPTTKNASRIEAAYENSDQRERFLPCPHCGHMQTLEWEQLKFEGRERGKITNIRYECVSCKVGIEESEKHAMDLNGQWIAKKPFAGIAGFFVNELYSPWVRWVNIIEGFLEALKDPNQLKVWWNTSLGKSWEIKSEAPEWKKLYDRRENFPMRVVPPKACLLTASCDVQQDRLEVRVMAWARDKQNWTIEARVLVGDTTSHENPVWRELDTFIAEEFSHAASGVLLPIRMTAIDSAYRSSTVYSWVRGKSPNRVMAVKGSDTLPVTIGTPKAVDLTTQGKRITRSVQLWPVGVSKIKEDLYSWLKIEKPLDGAEYPPCYCHFPEFDDEFFKQLTAENLLKKVGKNKFATYEWVKSRDRNESLDLWVYGKVAAVQVGLDRMTDEHWNDLEEYAGIRVVQNQKEVPVEDDETPKTESDIAKKPGDDDEESYLIKRRKSNFW